MFKYSCLVVSLFATNCMANDDAYMQCVQDYLPRAEFDAAALVIKQHIPFVPHALLVLHLYSPDDGEIHASVTTFCAELNQ